MRINIAFGALTALLLTSCFMTAAADDPGGATEQSEPAQTDHEASPTDAAEAPGVMAPRVDLPPRLPLDELRIFAQVFHRVSSAYVEDIDDRTLLENAIRGMLTQLDPHSAYLDKDSFSDLQESTTGNYGGLGLEVGMEDGLIRVITPMDDTPADLAGIRAGDLIVRIDGKAVKGMSLMDAVKTMRGDPGSEVTLTILRDGRDEPFTVTLERSVIRVESVKARMLDDGPWGAELHAELAWFEQATDSKVVLRNLLGHHFPALVTPFLQRAYFYGEAVPALGVTYFHATVDAFIPEDGEAICEERHRYDDETFAGEVKLVAPPLYVMTVSALDKARGIQLLADAIAEIEEAIKASKGALQVKVAPRAVDERDDKLLNSLMSTLDAQNQEVDGDADEDEQDEGMGSADISGV